MTSSSARYLSLDVCRGLGVLGILIVNAIGYAQPFEVYENPSLAMTPLFQADLTSWWIINTFGNEKFYTLLAMLFGVGIFLSTGREDQAATKPEGQKQNPRSSFFSAPMFRRQIVLMLFGCVHGFLIWDGDILLLYGVTGLLMWNWRHVAATRLLLSGGVLYTLGTALLIWAVFAAVQPAEGPISLADGPIDTQAIADKVVGMRGDFMASLNANAVSFSEAILGQINMFAPQTLGLMMLGLGLYKTGFLKGASSTGYYLVFIGLGALSLGLIGWQNLENIRSGFAYPDFYTTGQVNSQVLSLFVTLGYISLIMLGLRIGFTRWLMTPLAVCGRMSLSVYILQSVLMTALCYGGRGPAIAGLPLYGKLNIASLLPIVAGVWLICILFSAVWLKVCHYGPLEWLWRRLWKGRSVLLFKRVDIRV
jgi:uncharacterized protein